MDKGKIPLIIITICLIFAVIVRICLCIFYGVSFLYGPVFLVVWDTMLATITIIGWTIRFIKL